MVSMAKALTLSLCTSLAVAFPKAGCGPSCPAEVLPVALAAAAGNARDWVLFFLFVSLSPVGARLEKFIAPKIAPPSCNIRLLSVPFDTFSVELFVGLTRRSPPSPLPFFVVLPPILSVSCLDRGCATLKRLPPFRAAAYVAVLHSRFFFLLSSSFWRLCLAAKYLASVRLRRSGGSAGSAASCRSVFALLAF